MVLPIGAMVISGFAGLTFLTKNSFIEEIGKQYVMTARAKGLVEHRVLYGHVFRNAMLIVIAGFPAAFIHVLFTGSLLTEVIFSLDGLGLLGFEAAISRDYPVMFGTLYFFGLVGLVMGIVGDLIYTVVATDVELVHMIEAKGWILWPAIPYRYDTRATGGERNALLPPSLKHPLGTDDQARDVLARVIYGFRISVLFGFTLTVLSSIVGIAAGAVQGYFGGWVDLGFQRFLEVWSSLPTLYLLIILASLIQPTFWILLG